MKKYVKKSLSILRKVQRRRLDNGIPLIVNFSGGKDSLACLLLALEVSDNVECAFMDSGQELPKTLPYVKERAREFGCKLHVSHPERDRIPHKTIPEHVCLLPDYIRHFGYFPPSHRRYCSIWLKQRPMRIHLRKKFGEISLFKLTGIRLSESSVRRYKYGSEKMCKKYGGKYVRPDNEHSGSFLVMPILHWTNPQLMKFLEERKVELHTGYKVFGVSGCKWCPIMKTLTARKIEGYYPHIYDELREVEAEINKPAWMQKRIWLRDLEPINIKKS